VHLRLSLPSPPSRRLPIRSDKWDICAAQARPAFLRRGQAISHWARFVETVSRRRLGRSRSMSSALLPLPGPDTGLPVLRRFEDNWRQGRLSHQCGDHVKKSIWGERRAREYLERTSIVRPQVLRLPTANRTKRSCQGTLQRVFMRTACAAPSSAGLAHLDRE